MRFKIRLQKEGGGWYLPINYQYELSSAIYRTIDRANSGFSKFLHDQGYLAFGKKFRLFTFSRIQFQNYKIIKEAGRIEHFGEKAEFEISFLVDRAAEEFIKGLFMDQVFVLGDKVSKVNYVISSIEAVSPPLFQETMHYHCLSPIFIKRKRLDGGEDYLHPADKEYGMLMVQNLLSKSMAFIKTVIGQESEKPILPDFEFKPKGKVYKNGVKIKQLTEQETMLIGYMYEFELRVLVELHEIGYYAGFGQLGSQGFGCVGVK
ncbi:CRISPR-associated endoribonuclease Cas6 [Aquiflexum balticum DSM 16537]|uniref:CRISPR-associated endoribonuclease n=1 Tax=Aquiflexum balticum DSM 16537 TaxID=758820 RepID=A0A1W2H7F8_9BACT|nr:CRISPR-associated endoribonuclease Cas6 [Aquiflexum balticum]SMD44436.1 CRISPR-associated endoribonuclease Cas6 [Aquiflexum balticum DSM 16537]